jgi:hypothetical protein
VKVNGANRQNFDGGCQKNDSKAAVHLVDINYKKLCLLLNLKSVKILTLGIEIYEDN